MSPESSVSPSECAVVTGAGAGLGRAIAHRLAADGFVVALLDIDADGIDETRRLVEADGGAAQGFVLDLRDEVAIDEAIRRVDREIGPVRALVNDAAVFPSGPFLDATAEEYDQVIAVNQRAYYFAAQSAARLMRNHGGGAIVNLGSITQHGGWSEMASYVVTKGAAAALTRALATELGEYGIRVNCVAPGAFPTRAERVQHADHEAYERRIIDSQALKRRGTEAELAAAVSFLIGPDASFVTGQTLNVDGGYSVA
jgi:NAD(P)-dependent dehydrogenase (short-subunit alcohol dehydrogenase family)